MSCAEGRLPEGATATHDFDPFCGMHFRVGLPLPLAPPKFGLRAIRFDFSN